MNIPARRKRRLGASPITVALMTRLMVSSDLAAKSADLPPSSEWIVLIYNQDAESVVTVIEEPGFQAAQQRWIGEVRDRGGNADPLLLGKPGGA